MQFKQNECIKEDFSEIAKLSKSTIKIVKKYP